MSARISETRSYNSLKQLTSIYAYGAIETGYGYPSTKNNGKIASQNDAISGETVTYAYDTLNRLASANNSGASPSWGQSFAYDGFGNLTQTDMTQGSAPMFTASYNSNNQVGNEDANGNPPSVPLPAYGTGATPTFDVENRLVQLFLGFTSPAINYAYDPANHRVWRYNPNNSPTTDEITFWSITGQKLGTYQLTYNAGNGGCCYGEGNYQPPQFTVAQTDINLYFGAELIKNKTGWVYPDRLGSIGKFYPYGIERPSATTNDTEKFTGYFRDAESGNDYAVNRYQSPGYGRFLTPDPKSHPKLTDPGSWNKYAYVKGDPINRRDPQGLCSSDGDFWDDDDEGAVYLFDGDCSDDPNWVAEVSTLPFVMYNDEPFWTAEATGAQPVCPDGQEMINGECDVPLSASAAQILSTVYQQTGWLGVPQVCNVSAFGYAGKNFTPFLTPGTGAYIYGGFNLETFIDAGLILETPVGAAGNGVSLAKEFDLSPSGFTTDALYFSENPLGVYVLDANTGAVGVLFEANFPGLGFLDTGFGIMITPSQGAVGGSCN